MTRTADVVVVGAGACGTSVAYHLAALGVRRVLVLDEFRRQFTQPAAVVAGLNDSHQRLDARVMLVLGGEAQVVAFGTHRQEAESGFIGDKAKTDSRVGPAAADRFRDAAMIACQSSRRGTIRIKASVQVQKLTVVVSA